jgi:hypothetical protein
MIRSNVDVPVRSELLESYSLLMSTRAKIPASRTEDLLAHLKLQGEVNKNVAPYRWKFYKIFWGQWPDMTSKMSISYVRA